MVTVKAEDVRIPREAREAISRGEHVVVMNRARPAFAIVRPEAVQRRGRPLMDALEALSQVSAPDPEFANDLEAVLGETAIAPADPWERS